MTFRYIILLGILAFLGKTTCAQVQANYWYFGKNKGLYFGDGVPQVLTDSKMYAFEGCATISDKNGQLLFYTNGIEVYNRHHQLMQNGSGLFGDDRSSQSAIILPVPNDPYKYYIFTVDAYPFTIGVRPCKGINYSIVDITKNGGLGDIVTKNITSQKLAGIPSADLPSRVFTPIPHHMNKQTS